jgi:hypothetical protein
MQEQISSMVQAGTKHYKANLEQVGNKDDPQSIYEACRLYNSGKVNPKNLNDTEGAGVPDYVSDIANRLMGRTD